MKEKSSPVSEVESAINGANVIFVRRYAQPTAYPISVRVDGDKVASLKQRRFTAITLPEGNYTGKTKWPLIATQLSLEFPMEISGDGPQFFEIFGEVSAFGGDHGGGYSKVAVRERPVEEGLKYIANCCQYVAPKTKK